MSKARWLLLLSGMMLAGHLAFIYPALPVTIATHFDAQGSPNGWMSKGAFIIFEVVLLAFVVGEFLLVPWFVRRLPDSLINLPNKKFWLSKEHRDEAFAIFGNYFAVFGSVILILFTVVNHFVYLANISRQNLSGNVWYIIVAFLIFVIVWMIIFIREFRIKR